jgi:integrase
MPTVKMTDAAVRRLTAPKGVRIDYFDAAFPGLTLRVTGAADQRPERKIWTLFYRHGGKQRRLTFEPGYPALGLADARHEATQAFLKLRGGIDPANEKAKAKAAATKAPDTITNVVDLFIKRHLEAKRRAPRYIEETRRNFDNHVIPRWKDRDIKTIGRRDVTELLDAVMDQGSKAKGKGGKGRHVPGGPIAANRTLAAIRALFNFCLRRGIIDATPVALVERPGEETRRERTLSADEIRAVWGAASALGYPFGPFFQLALITAQRRDEVGRMRWADLDLEAKNWTLPAEATKAGRTHVVPLAPLAIDVLRALPRKVETSGKMAHASPWVFTTAGDAPVSGFSKAKPRLDGIITKARDREALPPWTIHDLRRTAATEMGRLGASRFIIGKVLNHADRTVTGIYDRFAYAQEKRHALEMWARYLQDLAHPSDEKVVVLSAASRSFGQ